jgi:uncharacterized protein (TIGR03790 family)
MDRLQLRIMKNSRVPGLMLFILSVVMPAIVTPPCSALEPREVLVLANRGVPDSINLSKYYMKMRGIPENHLVVLTVPDKEQVGGEDYEKYVAVPVKNYLRDKDPFRFIRCLVLMYGMPLSVTRSETADAIVALKELKARRDNLEKQIKSLNKEEKAELQKDLARVKKDIVQREINDRSASLDSEIALVLEANYNLEGWIPNPFFLGYRGKQVDNLPGKILMIARLDGPSDRSVRKMIDDTLSAEKRGLEGAAYFDARWPEPQEIKTHGYAFYDQSIHRAAKLVQTTKKMPVVLDNREALFQPGDCPEAAVYCGWYSLGKYIDAFVWQQGAVGYHIASSECKTLKNPTSQVWCKRMIEEGVVATLGPVGEPYVEAFPPPEIFFGLLIEGRLPLVECFAASNPFLSWKMVLIGDPLYRPFKNVQMTDNSAVSPPSQSAEVIK